MTQLRSGFSTGISDEDRFPGVFALSQTDAMGLGDNVSVTLQKLIEEAELAGNAVVDIPPGVFVVENLKIRTGGIHLRGAGSTRTTLIAPDGNPMASIGPLFREPPALLSIGTDEGGEGIDANDVTISGMTLDGNVGAYTDDVILGNDGQSGVVLLAGNRLAFIDVVVQNMPRHGVTCWPLANSSYTDIRFISCKFFDIGQFPLDLRTLTNGLVTYCEFARSGDSSINLAHKPGFTSLGGCVDCEILFNHVTRADPPVRIFTLDLQPGEDADETGFLIAIQQQSIGILVQGNHLIDNRNATNDGIGVGVEIGAFPKDCRIVDNFVTLAGGFGIDVGSGFVVSGNYIDRSRSHGIFYGLDSGGALEGATIENNTIVDADQESEFGAIAGISFGGGLVSNVCTSSNTVVKGNFVYDTRSPKRCEFGLQVAEFHDPDSFILDGNRFEDVLTSSINIRNGSTITNMRLGDNHFIPGEWYGTLELVAGTVNTATLPMPTGTAMVASVSRTDKLTSTGIGRLEALSVPATPRFTLNALDAAAALETNDVSEVVWQCTGTADAY